MAFEVAAHLITPSMALLALEHKSRRRRMLALAREDRFDQNGKDRSRGNEDVNVGGGDDNSFGGAQADIATNRFVESRAA